MIDAARAQGREPSLVVDDAPLVATLDGVRVVRSDCTEWTGLGVFDFVVAVGNNATRASILTMLKARGGISISVLHSRSVVSRYATLGSGSVVFAGVVVNPGARVGENCILNTSCSIDHDCILGTHVHLCPGVRLAGMVTVGEGAMLGTGAIVIPGVKIGAWSVVGAGAVVVKDVPDRCVVFGNPARVVRRL